MARKIASIFNTAILFFYGSSTIASGSQLNVNENFGSDIVKEMPLTIGAGPRTPLKYCRSISGSIIFTPKALRFYVFKGENDDQGFSVQADNTQHARNITIGSNECQITLVATRHEVAKDGLVDLPPEAGSGVPGAERENVLDEREMYVAAAYFPSSKTDCGRLNTSFRFNSSGLMLITNLANGFSIKSRISDNRFYRTITFTHDACITTVDVHFYSKIDGKNEQEEQK